MRSIGFFSVLLWPFCCKLVIHDIVNRATVKWLGEKRCGQHPAGSYEALRTLFPLRTRVNSQHGQRSQPLQQVDSASNVRDLPTFNMISLHPRRWFLHSSMQHPALHGSSESCGSLHQFNSHPRKLTAGTWKWHEMAPWKRIFRLWKPAFSISSR